MVSSSDENWTVEMYAKRNRSWGTVSQAAREKQSSNKPMGHIVTGVGIELSGKE
jgi:hypothetical protein